MSINEYVGYVVQTNNDDGNGWIIREGPLKRAEAREKRKEYKESGEYLRVRILPVGEGVKGHSGLRG